METLYPSLLRGETSIKLAIRIFLDRVATMVKREKIPSQRSGITVQKIHLERKEGRTRFIQSLSQAVRILVHRLCAKYEDAFTSYRGKLYFRRKIDCLEGFFLSLFQSFFDVKNNSSILNISPRSFEK